LLLNARQQGGWEDRSEEADGLLITATAIIVTEAATVSAIRIISIAFAPLYLDRHDPLDREVPKELERSGAD
jgi:hypothetical protein